MPYWYRPTHCISPPALFGLLGELGELEPPGKLPASQTWIPLLIQVYIILGRSDHWHLFQLEQKGGQLTTICHGSYMYGGWCSPHWDTASTTVCNSMAMIPSWTSCQGYDWTIWLGYMLSWGCVMQGCTENPERCLFRSLLEFSWGGKLQGLRQGMMINSASKPWARAGCGRGGSLLPGTLAILSKPADL